jgi:hypothetical protein
VVEFIGLLSHYRTSCLHAIVIGDSEQRHEMLLQPANLFDPSLQFSACFRTSFHSLWMNAPMTGPYKNLRTALRDDLGKLGKEKFPRSRCCTGSALQPSFASEFVLKNVRVRCSDRIKEHSLIMPSQLLYCRRHRSYSAPSKHGRNHSGCYKLVIPACTHEMALSRSHFVGPLLYHCHAVNAVPLSHRNFLLRKVEIKVTFCT